MPAKVIIDCDPGNGVPGAAVDDALALGLALSSVDLRLQAVTVVDGNTPRDIGSACARTLLDIAGAVSVPVHSGAARGLLEPHAPWAQRRRGGLTAGRESGLWEGIPAPRAHPAGHRHLAASELAARIADEPGAITLVAIGPLTNVAQALTLHPRLAEDVGRIVVMGGAFDVPGYPRELNFAMDPEAARMVLASGAPITLVPLDVTITTALSLADLSRFAVGGSPLAAYLSEITAPWIRYSERTRGRAGCALHDPLAVAVLLDDTLAEVEERIVEVEVTGPARGTLSGRPAPGAPGRRPVSVVTAVDNERLVDLLVTALAA